MSRVLALDYGSARCGCALSDPSGTIVTPIEAIARPGEPSRHARDRGADPRARGRARRRRAAACRCAAATPIRRARRASSRGACRCAWGRASRSSCTTSATPPTSPATIEARTAPARTRARRPTCSRAGCTPGCARVPERTEEERERDRAEREARRADSRPRSSEAVEVPLPPPVQTPRRRRSQTAVSTLAGTVLAIAVATTTARALMADTGAWRSWLSCSSPEWSGWSSIASPSPLPPPSRWPPRRRAGADPRGRNAPADRRSRARGRTDRQLSDGVRALPAAEPRPLRRAGRHAQPRRVPVPGHLRSLSRRPRRPARARTADRLHRTLRRRRGPPRARAAPHPLRAADRRLDGRTRGAAARRSREGRGGHLQPPARWACRSGSTRPSATR